MVTKNKAGQKKGRVKVGKLNLKKETIKNLSVSKTRMVKGGFEVAPAIEPAPIRPGVIQGCSTLCSGPARNLG